MNSNASTVENEDTLLKIAEAVVLLHQEDQVREAAAAADVLTEVAAEALEAEAEVPADHLDEAVAEVLEAEAELPLAREIEEHPAVAEVAAL